MLNTHCVDCAKSCFEKLKSMSHLKSNFRHDINGLRAVAVLSVILFHFEFDIFSGGFVGVDVFFVISGFLMTKIIFTGIANNNFSILRFYADRTKRIVPALVVLSLVVIILGWIYVNSVDYRAIGKHVAASISFLSNYIYWSEAGYFDAASHEKWLLHTWSLSVEWQFYILYPFLILILKSMLAEKYCKLALLIFALISFCASIFLSELWSTSSFYFLHTRAWEMLLGGLVFLYPVEFASKIRNSIVLVSVIALLGSIILIDVNSVWPGWLAIIPVFATAAIIACHKQDLVIITGPVFQWLGNVSYSLYLWHWPVIVFIKYVGLFYNNLVLALGLFVSLMLAWLSYQFVETPTRRYLVSKNLFSSRYTVLVAFSGLVFLFGAFIYVMNGMPERIGEEAALVAQEAHNKHKDIEKCLVFSGVDTTGCRFGDVNRSLDLIVLGDSHAMSLMSAIFESHPKEGKHMLFLGYSGCPTLRGVRLKKMPEGYACAEYLEKVIDDINNLYAGVPLVVANRLPAYIRNDTFAGVIGVEEGGPLIYFDHPAGEINAEFISKFQSRFIETICELSEGRETYVVEAIPEMVQHVPKYMERQQLIGGVVVDLSISLDLHQQRSELTNNIIRKAEHICGAKILNPVSYFCTENRCFGSEGGRPLYFDGDHLSEFGNKRLIPMFRKIWGNGDPMF